MKVLHYGSTSTEGIFIIHQISATMIVNRRLFLRQLGLGTAGVGLLTALPDELFAAKSKAAGLPRATPESQGISSSAINAFLDAIGKSKIEFHSVMIVRHGNVIAEGWWAPYAADRKHTLYSLSKSFTSTAVGLAINEGKFKTSSPVLPFFEADAPATVSKNLAAMTIKDLLTMSTGHAKDTIGVMRSGTTGESWAKIFLAQPVEFEPGTHFLYNTGSTYMQSAIIQKTTGQNVLEYLKPRLFEPLEIEGMDWELDPQGIVVGGYGLRVKTEDIARFGQMYLQKGKVNGKQLVPAAWIAEATSKQVDNAPEKPTRPNEENDWAQGYGYQFWRCTHNAVRGDGAFGQFCIMMPDQDAMIAITSESFDLQGSMKLVWDHLQPAMKASSLPPDKATQKNLESRLKSLALVPTQGNATSPNLAKISGKTFKLDENPYKATAITLDFNGKGGTFSLVDDKGPHKAKFGINSWVEEKDFKTRVFFPSPNPGPVVSTPLATSGAWSDDNTFFLTIRYAETAHGDNIFFTLDGDKLTIKLQSSVAKGNPNAPDPRAPVTGTLSV
jgi:CubicO group peptidase (beta-lactamase class C family)